jgi:hypothetical protein
MRIYAERPGRAVVQLLADLLAVGWVLLVVQVARTVGAAVLALQTPANRLTGAGDSIRGAFDDAARTASGVPCGGDDLARALGRGTQAGDSLAASGRGFAGAVGTVATSLTAGIVFAGAVPVVLLWLALRARWVRAAGIARQARATSPDLLALHALAHRSPAALLRVAPAPAEGWRTGDPAVVAALAAVELKALGLRGISPSP